MVKRAYMRSANLLAKVNMPKYGLSSISCMYVFETFVVEFTESYNFISE